MLPSINFHFPASSLLPTTLLFAFIQHRVAQIERFEFFADDLSHGGAGKPFAASLIWKQLQPNLILQRLTLMKTGARTLILLIFLFTISFSQEKPKEYTFLMRGRVVDKNKEPYYNMPLEFFRDGTKLRGDLSDENGYFSAHLPAGKYRIRTAEKFSKDFLTFIEITENGLNPTNFELVLELNKDWCANCPPGQSPEVVKYVAPPYPPVALAASAIGEVVINIKIDSDGKVVYAKAISGHPLMRKVSDIAAQQWIFTADKTIPEREGKLIFLFDLVQTEKPIIRLKKPNRLEILYKETLIIQTTNK